MTASIEQWKSIKQELGFTMVYEVEGRSSIADLFKPSHRCGIYILNFSNGEWYVGQAKDVTRRFVQHTKTHSDISKMSFREFNPNQLNDVEQRTIHTLERQGYRLRNVVFTSEVIGERDFDLIMPREQQNIWLSDLSFQDIAGRRLNDSILHQRGERNFLHWMEYPKAKDILEVLNQYIMTAIPAVFRSEAVFWSLTCLPNYSSDTVIFNRVNINMQEVFTISAPKNIPNQIDYSLHLAHTPLRKAYGPGLIRLWHKAQVVHQIYEPGGEDQVCLFITNTATMVNLLQEKPILSAIRLFNLRLMRKGPTKWSRNHCINLVDQILEEGTNENG
jgi:hypothetical protein